MTDQLTGMLKCPVTRRQLSLQMIRQTTKQLDGSATTVKEEGVLYSDTNRRNRLYNLFNCIRSVTSILPLNLQYYLYRISIFH